MTTVTISPRFQVTIPKEIRKSLRLVPGQELEVVASENRITLIPIRAPAEEPDRSEHLEER